MFLAIRIAGNPVVAASIAPSALQRKSFAFQRRLKMRVPKLLLRR
jgi:hypothetical protein